MSPAQNETTITKDAPGNKLVVVRAFNAPLEKVWKAWTEAELLDQWWAPKPWKANTKTMAFKEGGSWFYFMQGPDGTRQYCRVDYKKIITGESFTADDALCNEEGAIINDPPGMHWVVNFSGTATGTLVKIEITFASEADLEKIVSMGFKEGFTMAHSNLDDLLGQ